MAKRKLSLSDLSSGNTGWAQELRVKKENAKAKAKAYADDMRSQGVPVSAADEASFAYKFERGEEIDFAGPDFSDVEGRVDSTEGGLEGKLAPADDVPSLGRRAVRNLFGSTLGDNIADAGATALESTKSIGAAMFEYMDDKEREILEEEGMQGADIDDASLGLEARLTERGIQSAKEGSAASAAARAKADDAASAIQNQYEDNSLGYHAMGIARSAPVMAAAVATRSPAIGAMLVGTTTAAQARSQALAEGATEEDAELAAITQGAIEGSFDLVTLGIAKYGVGPVTKKLVEKFG